MKTKRFKEIIKFCLGGGVAVVVGYIILYALTEYVMLWYVLSSVIAYLTSNTINFIIQKFWVFGNVNQKAIQKQYSLYMILTVLYFLINTVMIYVLTEYCHIYYILSQIILTVVISIASYFTTKKIFHTKPNIV